MTGVRVGKRQNAERLEVALAWTAIRARGDYRARVITLAECQRILRAVRETLARG